MGLGKVVESKGKEVLDKIVEGVKSLKLQAASGCSIKMRVQERVPACSLRLVACR